ncbi:MAG: hypothetical protein EU548_03825, partial [Promethearchaeota archaeon]
MKTKIILLSLGIMGWGYYALILLVFYNYISFLMLAGITATGPTLFLSIRARNRSKFKEIFHKRFLMTGLLLGIITLALFPNLPRIPSQIERRIDRCNLTITPDNPKVKEFTKKFLDEQGGEEIFNNLSLRDRLDEINDYIQLKIVWTPDIETQYMAGDICTPEEAITLGKDDCRGQAVTTVSMLIYLGYDAYVVEMAWHWYTIVFDDDGKEYKVNQYGHLGNTKQYPILMIWNDEEIIYFSDPYRAYHATMDTSKNFYDYIFLLGPGVFIVSIILGGVTALYSTICMGDFKRTLAKERYAVRRFKFRLLAGICASIGLMGLILAIYFSPFKGAGAIYLFIYGHSVITTFLNL